MLLHGERWDASISCGWEYSHTSEIIQTLPGRLLVAQDSTQRTELRSVPRVRLESERAFDEVVALGQPVILEDLDIGSCTRKWSLDYLSKQIGGERKVRVGDLKGIPVTEESSIKRANHKWAQVVVHDSHSQSMDFNAKNFRYATTSFEEFITQVKKGKRQYLRALSADAPADQPANLEQDFPSLAPDFALPDLLKICGDNVHSTVLRISGPVHMWLHYGIVYIPLGFDELLLTLFQRRTSQCILPGQRV